MPGVVTSYLHGDRLAANKGGSLVTVQCETDFAAKTEVFVSFARYAARMAYAAADEAENGMVTWSVIASLFPEVETERQRVEIELGESVTVLPAAVQQVEEPSSVLAAIA